MCPFNYPPTIKGDHRLLDVDLDQDILFGTSTEKIVTPSQRGVKSKQEQMVQKFCKRVILKCNQNRIAECIDHLLTLSEFTKENHRELEQVDSQLTKILTTSNNAALPTTRHGHLPSIKHMSDTAFGALPSLQKNQRDMDSVLKAIRDRIQPPREDQLEQTRSLTANLHHAQKNLYKEKQEADLLCKQHLEALLNKAIASNKKKKSKALTHLIQAKCN